MKNRRRFARVSPLILAVMGVAAQRAQATTYTVTSTADDGSANTLRWAINQANSAGSGTIQINTTSQITLTSQLPVITFTGTINGTAQAVINGNNLYRGFFVDLANTAQALTISNLTITKGSAQGGAGGTGGAAGGGGLGAGGAIFVNGGSVTVSNVTTTLSRALGGNSGGSFFEGGGAGGGGLNARGGNASNGSGDGAGGGGGLYGAGGAGDYTYNSFNSNPSGGGGGGQVFGGGNAYLGGGGGGGAAGSAGQTPSGTSGGSGGTPGGGRGGDDDSNGGTNYNGQSGSAVGAGGGGAGATQFSDGNGGNGSKFGGGGGGANGGGNGGDFGGGGGSYESSGGNGGFGAGGGGSSDTNGGTGGFGAGSGAGYQGFSGFVGAGGGSALGGAIFVRGTQASLTVADSAIDSGSLTAGNGEDPEPGDDTPGVNGSAAGTSLFLYGGNTNLSVANGGTATMAGSIADAAGSFAPGSITKIGPGTMVFTGTNTYAGGTTISAGTLQIGNGGTAGSVTGAIKDNANLAFNRSDSFTFSGAVSGTGGLTQTGTGVLTINNVNSYSGGTTVAHGTLLMPNALPVGNAVINSGAVLQLDSSSGSWAQSGATFSGTGTLRKTGINTVSFGSNSITTVSLSAGAVVDVEGGTLAGSSAYQGDWHSNQSSLNIASGATFDAVEGGPNHAVQFDALTGSGALSAGYQGGTVVTLGVANGSGTFSGSISNDPGGQLELIKTGNGTQVLSGALNFYSTTVAQGTLSLNHTTLPGGQYVTIQPAGALQFDTTLGNVTEPGATFQGSGTIRKTGTNSLVLGTQAFSTATIDLYMNSLIDVQAGTLANGIGHTSNWVNNEATLNIASGATVDFTDGGQLFLSGTYGAKVEGLMGTGTLSGGYSGSTAGATVVYIGSNNSSSTFGGAMVDDSGGHLAIVKNGSGTLILTGTSTYSGGTTIAAGVLQLGNTAAGGVIAGPVVDNSLLRFDRTDNFTFSGALSGTGQLYQYGPGTAVMTTLSTHTGGSNIIGGTLDVVGTYLQGNVLIDSTLQYDTTAGTVFQAPATFTGISTFQKIGTNGLAFGGNGGVVHVQLSAGAVFDVEGGTVNGSYAYQGDWSSNLSSLNIAGSSAFDAVEGGPTQYEQFNALTGAGALRGGWSGNTAATTTIALGVGNLGGTFSGTISDDASSHLAIIKSGIGTQAFSGTASYTGGTTISAGTLQIGAGGTSGSLAGNVMNNATLAFNRSDVSTFAGVISGTGGVNQGGTGTTVLTGANTYSGGTTVTQGTLQIGSGTLGSITGNINNSGTVGFGRSDNTTFSGVISGNGGISKSGAGVLTVAQTETYTGTTDIAGGTLRLAAAVTAPGGYAAYYSFDNVSGNTVINGGSGGATYNGNMSGGATTSAAGHNGSALSLPSNTSVMNFVNTIVPNTGHSITESAWFNGLNSSAVTRYLFQSNSGAAQALMLAQSGYVLGDSKGGGGSNNTGVDLGQYATGWHQLTVTQSEGPFNTLFYIDGNLVATLANNFTYSDFLAIGNSSPGSAPFAQLIDDVYIYNNKVLSASEVQQLYQSASSKVGQLSSSTQVKLSSASSVFDVNGNSQTIAGLSGVAGSSVLLGSGSLTVNSSATTTYAGSISGAGSLIKSGSASLKLTGSSTYTGGSSVGAGTLVVGNTAALGTGALQIGASGTVSLTSSLGSALALPSLSVASGGKLDLANDSLVLNYTGSSPAATIRALLAQGDNGGAWSGNGITSSTAAGDTTFHTALAYAEASQLGLANGGTFDGQHIAGQAVLVKYTYYGDNDLDGKVTLNDFSIFVDGFNGLGSGWVYGDYDYNGSINLSDFALFVDAYKHQGAQLSSLDSAILSDPSLSSAQKNAMLSVVPEPGMASLLVLLGAAPLAQRQRRKR